MWEDLIRKAKHGGLDVIDTYVFWNVHEPSPGNVILWIFFLFQIYCFFFCFFLLLCYFSDFGLQYNFEGRYDLVRFIKTVQKVGLYANLRIGPYVCAEWNFGYIQLLPYFYVFFLFFFISCV